MLLEKVFHVNKKKLMLHKPSISCRQKQDDAAPKKYFVLKKVINFFRNAAPYSYIEFAFIRYVFLVPKDI